MAALFFWPRTQKSAESYTRTGFRLHRVPTKHEIDAARLVAELRQNVERMRGR